MELTRLYQRSLKQWSGYDLLIGVLQLQMLLHLVQHQEKLLLSVGYLQLFLAAISVVGNHQGLPRGGGGGGGGGGGANCPPCPPP